MQQVLRYVREYSAAVATALVILVGIPAVVVWGIALPAINCSNAGGQPVVSLYYIACAQPFKVLKERGLGR